MIIVIEKIKTEKEAGDNPTMLHNLESTTHILETHPHFFNSHMSGGHTVSRVGS